MEFAERPLRQGVPRLLCAMALMSWLMAGCFQDMDPSPGNPDAATLSDASPGSPDAGPGDAGPSLDAPPMVDAGDGDAGLDGGVDGGVDGGLIDAGPDAAI